MINEKIAVIGGLGTLSGADVLFKLLKNPKVLKNQKEYEFIFEQQPYSQINSPLYHEDDIKSRKFYSYNLCKSFESKSVSKILLPCFASHTFFEELQKEISIPIVNIFDALSLYLKSSFEKNVKIGILTSDYVKENHILKRYFQGYDLFFPTDQEHMMEAVYGENGIKKGYFDGIPLEYVYTACSELMDKGCEVIVPCVSELSLVTEQLWKRGVPILDVNQIYVDYALGNFTKDVLKPFKLGIVGGVGPSATVDFMNKIIINTAAKRDQDHIKMIIEQNPQIPDRTAHLIRKETDPTIAMFSICKKLEAAGVDAIAIPCNTAHAFVKSIQEHLTVPIINMLTVTVEYINRNFGSNTKVGLLATSGTVQSNVYLDVLSEFGFEVIIPDEEHQKYVMESIYGERGVKANFTAGICKDNILKAVDFIIRKGADVIILGCTELPLMFPDESEIVNEDKIIPLVDPTLVLAKKIVNLSKV
ncbi:aspartate racemase [Sphingobacterium sp. ML3W]|uniref:amino acid racemase n=1 Tax=Sphingobacterium sp. ML3W TaxID=1538644 RepID=UPI0004F80D53|nr:aspartate/glutamate racemase family protein [Sphingobacterium sp. ML3W]AIM36880.1 aspartate racemase [Sphingobacterium sp. ML3W]